MLNEVKKSDKEIDESNMTKEEKEEVKEKQRQKFLASMNRLEKKLFDLGLKMGIVLGDRKFVCKSCNIENCEVCYNERDQLKKNTFLTCRICKKGYALVDGKCRPCPLNCEYCKPQTSECVHCAEGFEFQADTNQCQAIAVENCSVMDGDACTICDNWFYLDEELNQCKPCKKEIDNCSHCRDFNGEVRCQFCQRGYYLNTREVEPGLLSELKQKKRKKGTGKSERTDGNDETSSIFQNKEQGFIIFLVVV